MRINIIALLMTTALIHASAKGYGQKISLNEKDAPVEKILTAIKKQSGYVFFYDNNDIRKKKASIDVANADIDEVLNLCFKDLPLTYTIEQKTVVISQKVETTNNSIKEPNQAAVPVTITGKVTDDKNAPLRGVIVKLKGGKAIAVTDTAGKFKVSVPDANSTLVFSFVGFVTKELRVTPGSEMTISLDLSENQLNDVVVVGYSSEKRELITGSVENMKFTEADKEIPTTMAGNILAGRMAGVNVGTPDGIPGISQPTITIRTPSSFSNTQPVLYVIDGKIMSATDFNNLSPNEIDNVSVLKDGSAASVYGSRAAGGVILVTTKRGKAGNASIQYSFNTGYDTRLKNVSLTTGVQMEELYNEINPGQITPADIAYIKTINGGYGYNQLATIFRNPFTATHNLSISGGTDKLKYFIGGSYVNQQGFENGLDYNKYNFRANITADLTKDLTLFTGIALNNNLTQSSSLGVGGIQDLYGKLLVWQPYLPVETNTGLPIDYGWIGNPSAETNGAGGYQNLSLLKPVINLNLTYKVPFIPGLSANVIFSKSYTDTRTKTFGQPYTTYVMKQQDPFIIDTNDADILSTRQSTWNTPGLSQVVNWSSDKQTDFQLNYERTFNKSHIKAFMLYESYQTESDGVSAQTLGFPVYTTDQWWATSTQSVNQYVSNSPAYSDVTLGRKSWVGQAFYDYDEKYIATAAYRYDGSMNFAPNKRWGLFPSGSVGWIVSKEKFMQDLPGIDFLKLSVAGSLVGNDAIGGWQWQQSYQTGNSAFFGTTPATNAGITYGGVPNPDLTWEKTFEMNYAVDIDFLKHFSSRIEYYRRNTYDILGTRIQVTPPTFSLALPDVNYGKEDAAGVDLSINYHTTIGQVSFNTGINASYGNAWIVAKDQTITYPWQNAIGMSTSELTGLRVVGMIRTQADLTNLLKRDPNYNFYGIAPALGQFIYADLSGPKGVPDGIIDDNDQTVLRKNNNPISAGWNFSASWKGFSLAATFNGMFHYWKSYNDLTYNVEWNRMWNQLATNTWMPNNPNAAIGKWYSANDGTGFVTWANSNFWYQDASFIRLKNLAVSYSIPHQYFAKLGVQGIKLYVSGSNLFIISKFDYRLYDPEMSTGQSFPIIRSFNFGATLSL